MRQALRRLPLDDFVAAVVARVKEGTGVKCVTDANKEPSPLYSVGAFSIRPDKTKTMWLDVYTIELHAISKPSKTREEIFKMVTALEEAMSQPISLACPFQVIRQTDNGLNTIKRDETGEWHAVVPFEVVVSYGLIIK